MKAIVFQDGPTLTTAKTMTEFFRFLILNFFEVDSGTEAKPRGDMGYENMLGRWIAKEKTSLG